MKRMNLLRLTLPLVLGLFAARGAPSPLVEPTDAQLAELGVSEVRRAVLSEEPASDWERAMVSGNGETGAMVMGGTREESIVLNRAGLFMPCTPPMPPVDQARHLPELRRMLAAGRYQEAADFVYALSQKEGYQGTHWTDPFVPVCTLQVRTPGAGEPADYLRGTDYATGVAGVRWRDEDGVVVRRLFVSRADDVVVLSLKRGDGRPVDCELGLVQHDPRVSPKEAAAPAWAFRSVESRALDGGLQFFARFERSWPGSLQGCEAAVRVVAPGGRVSRADGRLRVEGAREVLVLARTALVPELSARHEGELARGLERLEADYEVLLARHVRVHGELFSRMRLDLAGSSAAEHRLPSRELFARSSLEQPLPTLLEKQFDACRYLILSSSGERFPPTLQGVWGGTWQPAWSGDYTHDGNVPVAIIGNLPGNMPELLEGFFRLHEGNLAAYRENARRLFGTRGLVVPVRTGAHGFANHFGPQWCLTFWTAGGAWVAQTYYDYYLYTGDRAFLRSRAIPFMREVALFYEDFLAGSEGPDGRVVFSPSYSPENHPANTGSQATVNATMDVVACRELLGNLVAACRAEGIDHEGVARWERLLAKLPPHRVNEDGSLAEWVHAGLRDNHEHRHVSHFYELYTGLPAHVEKDARLMAAFRLALRQRTEFRRRVGGGEMAFGQAQMGAVAASLRLPADAYENLGMLSKWFWFPQSMMTAHNPESLFNTDIAGGIPQLMILMLADSRPGELTLLPALPEQWPSGRLAGALCRGGVELRELAWTPESVRAVLLSRADQALRVRVHGVAGERILQLRAGEPAAVELRRR